MSNLVNATVYMIVFNEEANIRAALNSAQRFAEILIVDSGSSDNTLSIIAEYHNTRIIQQDWQGFAAQKQFALDQCSTEWVVNLDADEVLSEEYVDAVDALLVADTHDALRGRRRLIRRGRAARNFEADDKLIRCFRRSRGRYNQRRVHEGLEIDGLVAETDAVIFHNENLSYAERLTKANHYSSLKALDKADAGDRVSFLVLLLIFPLSFLQSYLFKGHFLDGRHGLFNSMNVAFYNFCKYAKLAEIQSGQSDPEG